LAGHIRCPSIRKWAPIMTSPNTEREVRRRRRCAPSFKAKIVAACLQGDASIAQIALQHGLNTNLVQTWIRKAKRQSQLPVVPDFVPLPVSGDT